MSLLWLLNILNIILGFFKFIIINIYNAANHYYAVLVSSLILYSLVPFPVKWDRK